MGQQQSKDELLFQQVNYGNVEGIKALRSEGAGLEWIDREGKTALIAACMSSELYNVAKTLIEMGAKVNAYRPGRHAGTPLHHAAKRGLDQTVKLLLSHGANALVMNDDCQTPLDVARSKGYTNVVRTIENHICLFSGWLREFYGPGFLELFAPQLLVRRVWVVVLPCGSRNLNKPFKLELTIYSSVQDAQPRTLIALWKANLEEPNFSHPDPTAIISDIPNIPVPPIPRRGRRRRGALSSRVARCDPRGVRQTRIKLAAATETDKQQLQRFCNACKGIPQVIHQNFPFTPQAPPMPAPAPSSAEDEDLAMAINASIQSAAESRPPYPSASTSSNYPSPSKASSSGSQTHEIGSTSNQTQSIKNQGDIPSTSQLAPEIPIPTPLPSAPPIDDVAVDDGPIHYPSIDFSPIDLSTPGVENTSVTVMENEKKGDLGDSSSSSSCVICLDAPAEGACIPCGHMAGCMTCLNEIKSKKWGCPVCRGKIDQVIRVYAV